MNQWAIWRLHIWILCESNKENSLCGKFSHKSGALRRRKANKKNWSLISIFALSISKQFWTDIQGLWRWGRSTYSWDPSVKEEKARKASSHSWVRHILLCDPMSAVNVVSRSATPSFCPLTSLHPAPLILLTTVSSSKRLVVHNASSLSQNNSLVPICLL